MLMPLGINLINMLFKDLTKYIPEFIDLMRSKLFSIQIDRKTKLFIYYIKHACTVSKIIDKHNDL